MRILPAITYRHVFLLLALGALTAAGLTDSWALRTLCLWVAAAFGAIGLAYGRGWTGVFQKSREGKVPPLALFLFAPYLLLYLLLLILFRLDRRVRPYDLIEPGLYLGSRLLPGDRKMADGERIQAVLDLTAELPRVEFWREGVEYLCLPTLDATAPAADQLADGATWIARQREEGRAVYVHCAFGHGRSATLLAAYLLHSGLARTVSEAVERLKTIRPGVTLSLAQERALEEFARLENAGPPAADPLSRV